MPNLPETQRWMQQLIVAPGIDRPGRVEDLILPSSRQTSDERLAIYSRAYVARLIECLRAEYPMLCRALEQDLFDEFAVGYLAQHPPTSYTLAKLGEKFPDFLAAARPTDADADWSDGMIDLARLEWETNVVFDGPGLENEPSLDATAFADPSTLRVILAPCLRLLELRTPAHKLYAVLRDEKSIAGQVKPTSEGPFFVAVTRIDYMVQHHQLSAAQYALLTNLRNGHTLLEAVMQTYEQLDPQEMESLTAQLHEWFSAFAAKRFFSRIDSVPGESSNPVE
jgi:hypothetical protein